MHTNSFRSSGLPTFHTTIYLEYGWNPYVHDGHLREKTLTPLLGTGCMCRWEFRLLSALIGNCIIRRCSLVGVGVALLEEVCHWGWALRSQKLKPGPVAHLFFLLPSHLDVELSATSLAPCLPLWHHASRHDNNGLDLWTVSQPQLNVFL